MATLDGAAALGAAATSARDEAAFAQVYRLHFGPLSGYALALTGDQGAAVDVAQEAFTRLYVRFRRVRDPRAWLFFVATNLARDHWRRSTRDRDLTSALTPLTPRVDPAHDPWLRDLVERLPERLRTAVLLHYYADLPVEEVARLTHRPVGTVKRRLHEARGLLADVIGTPS
jgi:RNA polymerase sigma-70 factor (ECF subfamily)